HPGPEQRLGQGAAVVPDVRRGQLTPVLQRDGERPALLVDHRRDHLTVRDVLDHPAEPDLLRLGTAREQVRDEPDAQHEGDRGGDRPPLAQQPPHAAAPPAVTSPVPRVAVLTDPASLCSRPSPPLPTGAAAPRISGPRPAESVRGPRLSGPAAAVDAPGWPAPGMSGRPRT